MQAKSTKCDAYFINSLLTTCSTVAPALKIKPPSKSGLSVMKQNHALSILCYPE